jgi:hypothetical protein
VLVENQKGGLQGSDIQGLSADLLEAARRRNLSANSLAAYQRTWTRFLAWAAASNFDPRRLPFPAALEAYRFLGDGKNAAGLKQIRAALSFAYKHWDLKNPFAKIEPPLHKESQIRYLLLSEIRRFLESRRRATALPSRSIWPTRSSKPPAASMNLSSSHGAIAKGWGRKSSLSGSRAKAVSFRMCPSQGA